MDMKAYRKYYERLAQAREDIKKQVAAEKRPLWSLEYRDSFKDIMYAMIAEKMDKYDDPAILDVGCGTGFDFERLAQAHRFKGVGTDLSLIRLQVASANEALRNCSFSQADVQHLPFRDSSFDIIVFSEVIEHLPQPQLCLQDIYRVLSKGGFLLLTTPNRWDYFHLLGQLIPKVLRKRIATLVRGGKLDIDSSSSEYVPQEGMVEHIHLFTFQELKTLVEKTGFSVEEAQGGRFTIPFPAIFDRCRILQPLWSGLDRTISLCPLSKYLKSAILIVARKT